MLRKFKFYENLNWIRLREYTTVQRTPDTKKQMNSYLIKSENLRIIVGMHYETDRIMGFRIGKRKASVDVVIDLKA